MGIDIQTITHFTEDREQTDTHELSEGYLGREQIKSCSNLRVMHKNYYGSEGIDS